MKLKKNHFMQLVMLFIAMFTFGCTGNIANVNSVLPTSGSVATLTSSQLNINFSMKGKVAFVYGGDAGGIYVMDNKGLKYLTPALPESKNPAWSPDGKIYRF
jgi:hypothetical protein